MMRWARRLAALAIVASLALANLATQQKYVAESAQGQWDRTLAAARDLAALPVNTPIVLGMQDDTIGELVSLYTRGHSTWSLGGFPGTPLYKDPFSPANAAEPARAHGDGGVVQQMLEVFPAQHFDLTPDGVGHRFFRFDPPRGLDMSMAVALLPTRIESLVNDSQDRPQGGRFYTAKLADQRDMLVQVDTSLGHVVIPGHQDDVGLWQREGDFVPGGHGIQGVGRHLLFEVLGPVAGSRLLIDLTSAALAAQDRALPAVTLHGATLQNLAFGGRGSGRLLSAPIEPREIAGHYYIALDLDQEIAHFRVERHGLDGLYNAKLPLDSRGLVGFVRNISLLTPDQAAALQPPAAVPSVPAGLQTPGLLYGGVAEDGWVADKAWFQLATAGSSNRLRVKGDIAGLSPALLSGVVKILVDGEPVGEQKLTPGLLDLDLPIAAKSGPRRLEFEATATDRLPNGDGRLVSFHLASIMLEQRSAAAP